MLTSGQTVITSMKTDDDKIVQELSNPSYFDILPSDPKDEVCDKIRHWARKWQTSGAINEDVVAYVTNFRGTHPGNCKPLIKTHKDRPFPTRLLLSGSGTPIQPLSKFVQVAISHLTAFLPYQVIDTKEFLAKI